MTTNWLGARKVPCPHCETQPDQPCVDEYGEPLTWAPAHVSRAWKAER
jgi:hypothetical protein